MLPILLIVGLLCLSVSPVSPDLLLSFFLGSILIIVGMGIFTLGAETSMTPIGNRIGTSLTKSRNLPLILLVSLVLGFSITIAEPDLQVLAETVPHINNTVLLVTVGLGVGFFLAVCMLRIIRGIRLRWLLLLFYGVVFVLAALADSDFLSVAFDSGGVTTGPMTVPFILALGVGVSNIRSDRKAEADSFGLVALCSIGPILAVLVLGFFYSSPETVVETSVLSFANTAAIGRAYLTAIPVYLKEMAVALSPVVLIFLIFQVCSFRLNRRSFLKICVGILYTYVGLVLFLTGVNVGFSSLGTVLGAILVLMLVAKITSMVHVEADDARAPIDSMEASVVGKRTLVTQEDGAPKTIYYMTFQKVNGMRMELEVPGEDYGLAAEGDQGVLVARGEEFIVFKRMI